MNGRPFVAPLSPALHARIDFVAATVMLAAPLVLPLDARTRLISAGLGAAGMLIGGFTNYPFPLRLSSKISWKAHRRIENLSFPAYVLLPAGLGVLGKARDRAYMLGLLAAYVTAHVATDWDAMPAQENKALTFPSESSGRLFGR